MNIARLVSIVNRVRPGCRAKRHPKAFSYGCFTQCQAGQTDQASHQSQSGPVRHSKDPDSVLARMSRQIPSNRFVVARLVSSSIFREITPSGPWST